jgi:hypothetical protein
LEIVLDIRDYFSLCSLNAKKIPPINLQDFKIVDEASDAIYLNEDEIKRITNLDLSKQTLFR